MITHHTLYLYSKVFGQMFKLSYDFSVCPSWYLFKLINILGKDQTFSSLNVMVHHTTHFNLFGMTWIAYEFSIFLSLT